MAQIEYEAVDRRSPLIAHVIYGLKAGGMENGLVNLLNNMEPDRYRHAIICVTESSEFALRIKARNVAVFELKKRPGKDPGFYLRYWKLLRKLRPAIVHTRNLGTLDLIPVASVAGVRCRIHGEHGWHAADIRGTNKKYRVLRRLCDRAVNRYVAVSRDMAQWLTHEIGVDSQRISQIYNGVDTAKFSPRGNVARLPADFFPEESTIVGVVGRMDPIKNFEWLVEAVDELLRHSPQHRNNLRLIFVGDGPEIGNVRRAVESAALGKIVYFAGHRNDLAELYRAMNFLLLPSLNEGISNTILESMASGIPVVTTRVGGNPELVIDGNTGALVSANDRPGFIKSVLRYLNEPAVRECHGRQARERAITKFSLRSMVQRYTELYNEHITTIEGREVN